MFVTVEGIEGSGKTTLLSGLAERLRAAGRNVLVTREPGGTPAGDAIRGLFLDERLKIGAMTEALLVNAARAQHVEDVIRPALVAGTTVLCDRFVDSTYAYQGYGRGLDLAALRAMCDAATGGLSPDLTLLLDVSVAVSRARTRERGGSDRVESESDRFHEHVRRGFLDVAQEPRHCVLDGTLQPQALLDRALRELEHRARRNPA